MAIAKQREKPLSIKERDVNGEKAEKYVTVGPETVGFLMCASCTRKAEVIKRESLWIRNDGRTEYRTDAFRVRCLGCDAKDNPCPASTGWHESKKEAVNAFLRMNDKPKEEADVESADSGFEHLLLRLCDVERQTARAVHLAEQVMDRVVTVFRGENGPRALRIDIAEVKVSLDNLRVAYRHHKHLVNMFDRESSYPVEHIDTDESKEEQEKSND